MVNRHTAIHLGLMDNIKVSSSFVIHTQAKVSDVSKYCWLKKSFSSDNYFSNLDQEARFYRQHMGASVPESHETGESNLIHKV